MAIKLRLTGFDMLTLLNAYDSGQRGIGLEDKEGPLALEIKEAFSSFVNFDVVPIQLKAARAEYEVELGKAALLTLHRHLKEFTGFRPLMLDKCLELRDKLAKELHEKAK